MTKIGEKKPCLPSCNVPSSVFVFVFEPFEICFREPRRKTMLGGKETTFFGCERLVFFHRTLAILGCLLVSPFPSFLIKLSLGLPLLWLSLLGIKINGNVCWKEIQGKKDGKTNFFPPCSFCFYLNSGVVSFVFVELGRNEILRSAPGLSQAPRQWGRNSDFRKGSQIGQAFPELKTLLIHDVATRC